MEKEEEEERGEQEVEVAEKTSLEEENPQLGRRAVLQAEEPRRQASPSEEGPINPNEDDIEMQPEKMEEIHR
jgi:hypothetical protein